MSTLASPNASQAVCQCCYVDDKGIRCPNTAIYELRGSTWDDYTHTCECHKSDLLGEGDIVYRLDGRD